MLRELIEEDAIKMLEWMKDISITKNFDKNFSNYSINDCKNFIFGNKLNYSMQSPQDISFAVTNDTNEYKGTVSLKHINYQYFCAELAIIIIKSEQGSGIAKLAFNEIVEYGFGKLQLKYIYLSCKNDNIVANKFYLKMGAKLIGYDELKNKNFGDVPGYDYSKANRLFWYIINKN